MKLLQVDVLLLMISAPGDDSLQNFTRVLARFRIIETY